MRSAGFGRLLTPVLNEITYGCFFCSSDYAVVPGDTMVVLYFHPHGSVEVNNVVMYVSFPLGLINKTLSALSRLPYVNGRLVALNNGSEPVMSLVNTVNHPYFRGNETMNFWLVRFENATDVEISLGVGFSAVSVAPGDVIVVVIYSAVPYALSSCVVADEGGEVQLMVGSGWIGLLLPSPMERQQQCNSIRRESI